MHRMHEGRDAGGGQGDRGPRRRLGCGAGKLSGPGRRDRRAAVDGSAISGPSGAAADPARHQGGEDCSHEEHAGTDEHRGRYAPVEFRWGIRDADRAGHDLGIHRHRHGEENTSGDRDCPVHSAGESAGCHWRPTRVVAHDGTATWRPPPAAASGPGMPTPDGEVIPLPFTHGDSKGGVSACRTLVRVRRQHGCALPRAQPARVAGARVPCDGTDAFLR